jgi:hypothetical protein
MTQWVVYWNPSDYPGKYVVRGVDIVRGPPAGFIFHPECATFDSLEDARAALPPHLYRLERHTSDAVPIVEIWI